MSFADVRHPVCVRADSLLDSAALTGMSGGNGVIQSSFQSSGPTKHAIWHINGDGTVAAYWVENDGCMAFSDFYENGADLRSFPVMYQIRPVVLSYRIADYGPYAESIYFVRNPKAFIAHNPGASERVSACEVVVLTFTLMVRTQKFVFEDI